MLSVPLWVYRVLILGWALWLAAALVGWLRWGFVCFTTGGAWRSLRRRNAPPPPGCEVPANLLTSENTLKKVAEAVKTEGRLDIMVIGSRSATVLAPDGSGFPGRMEAALRDRLPTIKVNVNLQLQIKKTAADVFDGLAQILEGRRPTLVIWQTGTVDAMRSIDPDDFRNGVDEGVAALQKAGVDVVLINLQYSPRTETMISGSPYLDTIRVVAQEHSVPSFDRFAIMRHWNDAGDFDLFSTFHGTDMAKKVHACIGRALSTFVLDAARLDPAQQN